MKNIVLKELMKRNYLIFNKLLKNHSYVKTTKSVSMLLFLMGASTGAAYAVAILAFTDVKITQ
ncbi:hypothetical protein E1J05_25340, partial [Phocaeicola dorei]